MSFNLCRNTTYLFIPDYCITTLQSERKHVEWRFLFDPGINKPVLRQFHAVCSRDLICVLALFCSSHHHLPFYSRIKLQRNSLLVTDRNLCGLVSGLALEAVGWLFAATVVNCTVPCYVAKKCHSAVMSNPSSWWYWLTQFYRFLCCASTQLLP